MKNLVALCSPTGKTISFTGTRAAWHPFTESG
jgi:hypothetical protein